MGKKNYYAVVKGHTPGIYTEWSGANGAQIQVNGFAGAVYKGFETLSQAEQWYKETSVSKTYPQQNKELKLMDDNSHQQRKDVDVVIYTDGACIGNPGPGGYGVVILHSRLRTELSGGYSLTTNNRMELAACIVALNSLTTKKTVSVISDSQYVVNGISKGWARNWRSRGWRKRDGQAAENIDLWAKLLEQCDKHDVEFVWTRGHVGTRENERCDELSLMAASGTELPIDIGYTNQVDRTEPDLFTSA